MRDALKEMREKNAVHSFTELPFLAHRTERIVQKEAEIKTAAVAVQTA